MSESPNNETVTLRLERRTARFIALGVGIIAILVGLVALLIDGGISNSLVARIGLPVGVIGLIAFVMLDPQAIATALTGRQARYASNSLVMSLAFIAILVTVYVLLLDLEKTSDWMTIDVTEDQQFSLSEQTVDLLSSLEEPVHIIGFYSNPGAQQDAELLLQEYQQKSNGLLTYEFIDPNLRPGVAQQYSVTRDVLILSQSDRTAEATFADEQSLTGALARVLAGSITKVYVLTGHGERSIDGFDDFSLQTAADALNRGNFEVASLNLLESGEIPEDAGLLIIAGPTSQFREEEIDLITTFTGAGGALMVMMEPSAATGLQTSGVLGIAYSPDGDFFVTAGADDLVKVWDADSRDELTLLDAHVGDVYAVAVSPDGDTIASASADTTLVLSSPDGEVLNTLEGHQALVIRVAYAPNGSLLASASVDQSINLWNPSTGEIVQTLFGQTPAYDIAFSPDSQLLAAGYEDGGVRIWSVKGEEIASQRPHVQVVTAVAFSPDGSTVLSVSTDGTVATLDVASGVAKEQPIFEQLVPLTDVTYLNDEQVAFAMLDGTIHVWDSALQAEQFVLQTEHTDVIWQMAVSPDGLTLATASADGSNEFWNLEDQERVDLLRGHSGGDPLNTYLANEWNVRMNDDIVVEPTNLSFDEVTPIVYQYGNSPITSPLNDSQRPTFFTAARSISFASAEPVETLSQTVLAATSDQSWGEVTLASQVVSFDELDTPGPLTLAMSVENLESGARLVAFGDVDFAANGSLSAQAYGNVDMLLNSANWLAAEESLISIQPRSSTFRSFTPMPLATTLLVVIGLICVIPLAIVGTGAVVWFNRRRRR